MTTIDRFDPFERRISEAINEIAAERRPDYLDSVFQVTARSRQRPRWAFPERWLNVNRLTLVAAAAAIALLIGGGYVLTRFNNQGVGGPPTPAPSPGGSPLVSGQGRGLGYATPAPDFLRTSTWLADVPQMPNIGQTGPRARILVSPDGNRVTVLVNDQTVELGSQPVTGAAGELWLVSTSAIGCNPGDFGRYQATVSGDGLTMTLTAVADACSNRATMLGRRWTRAFDADNQGGRGVITAFDPMIAITLPHTGYRPSMGNDSATLDAAFRTFIAVKNPMGWTEPCSGTGGTKLQLPNTIDAFVNYIGALPGFSIGQEDFFKIDGRDAAHILVPTVKTADCQGARPRLGQVIEWGTSHLDDTGYWFITQGDTDVIYVVQVRSDLYLLQWLGDGVTSDEEQGVLSTVHFLDSLP